MKENKINVDLIVPGIDEKYNIFNDEQKGVLLNHPEGTLYSYSNNEIKITSPFVLGVELYNRMNIQENMLQDVKDKNSILLIMKQFFEEEASGFSKNVLVLSDQYRDYIRKNDISLLLESANLIEDERGKEIRQAWLKGNSFLGSMLDTPYSVGGK